jgi:hypothetical protein
MSSNHAVPDGDVVHGASPSVVLCWVRDKARTVTNYVTQASGYAGSSVSIPDSQQPKYVV